MAYNTKVCKATGVTPFLAYFGREAKLPAELFDAIQQKEEGTIKRSAAAYEGTAKYQVGDLGRSPRAGLAPGRSSARPLTSITISSLPPQWRGKPM